MTLTIAAIIILVALALEAFFALSELSIISVNYLAERAKAEKGEETSRLITYFRDNPHQLVGTTLFGTNLSVVLASTVCSFYILHHHGDNAGIYTVLIMSPLVLVLAETLPKSFAQVLPEVIAPVCAPPLFLFSRLAFPVVAVLQSIGKFVSQLSGIKKAEVELTPEELMLLLEVSSDPTEIKVGEKKLIEKIFEFSEAAVEEAMVPLVHVTAVEKTASYTEVLELFNEMQFSRLPVYEERVDNIIGFLYGYDLIRAYPEQPRVTDIMRAAHYVPETMPADKLFEKMQKESFSIAAVVDEYGGVVGIITIEDMLEEVIGEISDEHDEEEFTLQKLDEDRFLVNGKLEIEKIREIFKIEIPDGDYETLAGFVIERLERMPKDGDKFLFDEWWFKVVESTPRRISLIELYREFTPSFPGEEPDKGPDLAEGDE